MECALGNKYWIFRMDFRYHAGTPLSRSIAVSSGVSAFFDRPLAVAFDSVTAVRRSAPYRSSVPRISSRCAIRSRLLLTVSITSSAFPIQVPVPCPSPYPLTTSEKHDGRSFSSMARSSRHRNGVCSICSINAGIRTSSQRLSRIAAPVRFSSSRSADKL